MKTRKQSHIAKKHNRIYKLRSKDTHRPVRAPIPSSLLFYNNNYFYALPLIESSYSLPSLGCGSRARLLGDTNTQRQNLFGVKLAGYCVFNANISFTFQAIKHLYAHFTYLCFGSFCKFFGDL